MLSLLFLLACALATQAAVHRIDVVHRPRHTPKHQLSNRLATASASSLPLDLDRWEGYDLWGNVTLGTPPQQFRLLFDPEMASLYIPGVGAVYYDPSSSTHTTPITDKRLYNASASSSYTAVGANYTSMDPYPNGTVGSDVLQMGTLQSTVTFEIANQVRSYWKWEKSDGVFGLSTLPDPNTGTTLLGQLQPFLDSPVYTLRMDYNTQQGQITLGGLAPDECKPESWTQVERPLGRVSAITGFGMPIFNVSGLTAKDCASCDGYGINVNMTFYFDNSWPHTVTSPEVLALFVGASGATYNATSGLYELTAEQVGAAKSVYLQLPSGGQIRMGPDDYIGLFRASHWNT